MFLNLFCLSTPLVSYINILAALLDAKIGLKVNKSYSTLVEKHCIRTLKNNFQGSLHIPICGRSKDQIVEDRSIGSDSDTPSHHDCHLKLVPILIASTERTLDANL